VDRQVQLTSQDGVKIPQSLDIRRAIVGFDFLDIIAPLGAVDSRLHHLGSSRLPQLGSLGAGWTDLVSSIGATIIFGQEMGELIQPLDPDAFCKQWTSVPTGGDYLAASVSTLKMLHEKRLSRTDPGIADGEMTTKILWKSACEPLSLCRCASPAGPQPSLVYSRDVDEKTAAAAAAGEAAGEDCNIDPAHFLVPKTMLGRKITARGLRPVNLAQLGDTAAVVFGHLSLRGKAKSGTRPHRREQDDDDAVPFPPRPDGGTSSLDESDSAITAASGSVSLTCESSVSTELTAPTSGAEAEDEAEEREKGSKAKNNKGKGRGLEMWKLHVPKRGGPS
jgi:hypothetical protein